ncbi:Imm1 family immunity protein [Streptomyces sp. NPDC048606]|uniref:Imm1 family immunity protein n=1 Tax=Streptomyces sp. NPDC048606 TaxID=3154726 RepID=UPI0034296E2D
MILNVSFAHEIHYAHALEEMLGLTSRVIEEMAKGNADSGPQYSGVTATFCMSKKRHTTSDAASLPDNFLTASVNGSSGYGALTWFTSSNRLGAKELVAHTWVSDNPNPPIFDPIVVGDSGSPVFHDRRSTLPIQEVTAAVEEFCRVGTGARPESIDWVAGTPAGHRISEGHL